MAWGLNGWLLLLLLLPTLLTLFSLSVTGPTVLKIYS